MIARKTILWNFAFAAILTLTPMLTQAQETHIVTVSDNFFNPPNLTIQAGDTVRWVNGSDGVMAHDVTADDFSFASQTTAQFTFDQTFNDPGEVPYHCTVHGAAGGIGMSGMVTVEGGGGGNGFQINPGLNDSWWNRATPGQGFFITVFENSGEIFLAWFTYDTERPDPDVMANLGEPGHRWLTAFGEYTGDTAMLEVELTQDGVFNSAEPPVEQDMNYGTILLEFAGCNEGLITYNIPSAGVQGEIPIDRIALDNVPACEELAQ